MKPQNMSDADLLRACAAARGAAHRAPFSEWSKDHRGHSSIVNHSDAWASRGNEFIELSDEVERRGLKIPACDCPPSSHEESA